MHPRPSLKTKTPRPECKLSELKHSIGKTIIDVEFGERASKKNCHEAEAIILHFSDGSSLSITVGSNVVNIMGGKLTKPSDLSTDLMVHWLDKDKSLNPVLKQTSAL